MTQRLILREESFGATVYDMRALSYEFVTHERVKAIRHGDDALVSAGETVAFRNTPGPAPEDTLVAPIRVYFEITTRCNAGCSYCLNGSGSARPGELATEEIVTTVRNMARDGVMELRLTGGEPLLRGDFLEIAQEVKSSGMALSMNSNLLCDAGTIDSLAELRPGLLVTSLDASPEAHLASRGPGFERISAGVRRLREADIQVRLNCVMSDLTMPHLGEFVDEFATAGCGFCFLLLRPVGRAGEHYVTPPLDELLRAYDLITAKRAEYPHCYFSTSFDVVMEQALVMGGIDLTGCNAIQKSFNINSDGSILPCAFLYELSREDFVLGNIRDCDYSVLPLWRGSERLCELRRLGAECNRRCIVCKEFKKRCRGSCVLMSLYAERSGRPDPYCRLSSECSH